MWGVVNATEDRPYGELIELYFYLNLFRQIFMDCQFLKFCGNVIISWNVKQWVGRTH